MSQHNFGSVLKRLEVDRSTGTLVCVGEDNLFGRIYFEAGKLRAARCGTSRGKPALERMNETQLVSVKFHDNVKLIKAESDDEEIGSFADGNTAAAADDVGAVSGGKLGAVTEAIVADASLQQPLTDASREMLAEELVEYVGPIAQMVVGGLEDGIGLGEALQLLAHEINDPQLAAEFVDRVRQKAG